MPITDLSHIIPQDRIDPVMATDIEFQAADAAHVNATDPHLQYANQARGDARYRQNSVAFFASAPFPTANVAGNSIAFSWNSVEGGLGIAELCNYAGLGGGDAFNFFRMPGNSTSKPTVSNRVARIDIAGAYIQSSDRRLKQNFSASPGLVEILALSPQRYQHYECLGFEVKEKKLKLGKNFTQKIGFIAQDVQKILPEAVKIPSSEEEPYGIDISVIVATLVRAVQELQAQITELKNRSNDS